jgi:cyanuric acid amidohydrolase
MSVDLVAFDMAAPDDLGRLTEHLSTINTKAIHRIALLMRVAGEYEDGSREKARAAVEALLARFGLSDRAAFITVIGSEGASTPCGFALIDMGATAPAATPRLALGLHLSPDYVEAEIGSAKFARHIATLVTQAMRDGDMDAGDVQCAIVNVPLPTTGNVGPRSRAGRAAAALGAGIALGEIKAPDVTDERIISDLTLYTGRVQTFTGPAIRNIEIIIIGNSAKAGGAYFACNTLTADLIDTRSIKRMMIKAGCAIDADGELETSRLVAVLAKLGVMPDGRVGGAPTTIYSSVTPPEKHVRAAMSGVLGATLHTTRIFSTFDPIQQAPAGGGTLCCILKA